jgi:NAD(P)-dependent dehydrogenase (short-subunit alcohol dehydrogenase family)
MGKCVAQKLKNTGFHVFALDKCVGEPQDGITPVQADITDIESIKNAFNKISKIADNLYAIAHFAGIYTLDSLVEMSEERFMKIFEVNLFGAARINKIFLPLLKKDSRILITTSELAPLAPLPFTGIYAITKSTLDKYAYSLRMELQLLGIKVSVLRPGAIDTGMIDVSTAELDAFCSNTKIYSCNARRFKSIVNSVQARKIPAQSETIILNNSTEVATPFKAAPGLRNILHPRSVRNTRTSSDPESDPYFRFCLPTRSSNFCMV